MKRTITLAVLALTLTACGGGGATDTAAPAAKPSKTASPKVEKPKNPLDTDNNKTACEASRREVGKRGGIFAEVGKGTALPEDGAKAAKKLQEEVGDAASYSSGSIQTNLLALSDAFGRIRVGLSTGDIDALTQGVTEQNAALEALDTDCTSIGR